MRMPNICLSLHACLLLLPWLGACAVAPTSVPSPAWPGVNSPKNYDFSWRLSGRRELAPLQVFDDGSDTWLQFPPQQVLPAIFIEENGGERLAVFEPAGPYLKVRGVWQALVFRGGNTQARASYTGSTVRQAFTGGQAGRGSPVMHNGLLAPSARVGPVADVIQASGSQPSVSQVDDAFSMVGTDGLAGSPGGRMAQAASVPVVYAASPGDGNMRRVLARWSERAGWTFDTLHWAVDIDVPLAGSASFGSDFMQAVRQLLGATELSEQPLQPCFYSNKVLRVVAWTQSCGRAQEVGGGVA